MIKQDQQKNCDISIVKNVWMIKNTTLLSIDNIAFKMQVKM